MTRFQLFPSFWNKCSGQDTRHIVTDVLCQDGAPVLHFVSQRIIVILETSDLKIVLRAAVKQILTSECTNTTSVTSASC